MAKGPSVAVCEVSSVSVPNIVSEVERNVCRLTEVTEPDSLPLSWLRNEIKPSGAVRPVTEAVMVRFPGAKALRFSEPRSIDSGSVETLLTSILVENVPKFWTTISGSLALVTVWVV